MILKTDDDRSISFTIFERWIYNKNLATSYGRYVQTDRFVDNDPKD